MSKSLKNFLTISDFLKEHDAETLRYIVLSSHYRHPLSYSVVALQQARAALRRLYTALRVLPASDAVIIDPTVLSESAKPFYQAFIAAMDDDFNTPKALSVLFTLAHDIQRLHTVQLELASELGALLRFLGGVINILQSPPETFLQANTAIDSQQIEEMLTMRAKARQQHDWATADRIRDTLAKLAIVIEDAVDGTTSWQRR